MYKPWQPVVNPYNPLFRFTEMFTCISAELLLQTTQNMKLKLCGPDIYGRNGEKSDSTSMYPTIQATEQYPVGDPQIIHKDFDSIDNYFGFVKSTVFPLKGLFHPVVPYRSNGKLMFPQCSKCARVNVRTVTVMDRFGSRVKRRLKTCILVWHSQDRHIVMGLCWNISPM